MIMIPMAFLIKLDNCLTLPETFNNFQDEDGCPEFFSNSDFDSDHDGISNAVDLCPNVSETHNNFQDEDGCPDDVLVEIYHL